MLEIAFVVLIAALVLVMAWRHPRPDVPRPSVKRLLAGTAAIVALEWIEPRVERYDITVHWLLAVGHTVIFLFMFGPDLRPTITRLGLIDPERVSPIEPR